MMIDINQQLRIFDRLKAFLANPRMSSRIQSKCDFDIQNSDFSGNLDFVRTWQKF